MDLITESLLISVCLLQFVTALSECGPHCSLCRRNYCRKCINGYHGDNCEKTCSENCLMGQCTMYTAWCNKGCRPGWWGSECYNHCTCGDDCFQHRNYCPSGPSGLSTVSIVFIVLGVVFGVVLLCVCCQAMCKHSRNNNPSYDSDNEDNRQPHARRIGFPRAVYSPPVVAPQAVPTAPAAVPLTFYEEEPRSNVVPSDIYSSSHPQPSGHPAEPASGRRFEAPPPAYSTLFPEGGKQENTRLAS